MSLDFHFLFKEVTLGRHAFVIDKIKVRHTLQLLLFASTDENT